MAKAKKLPSGNWRVLEYSHSEPRKDKKGKLLLDENGRIQMVRRYKSFTAADRREAEFMAAEWRTKRALSANIQDITLSEAYARYIAARHNVLSPSTIREYKRSARCDLQNLMPLKLKKISQELIQLEIDKEAATHSPKSIRNMHGLLASVLSSFIPNFKLTTRLPQKKEVIYVVPSDEDIKKILTAVKGQKIEKAILLSAFGSLRRGEISPLLLEDLYDNGVSINKAMVLDEHNQWVIKPPKTTAGYRNIDLPDVVMDILRQNIPESKRVVEMKPSQITDQFSNLLSKVGVKHFRFHDLRHYQASILHALGVPDKYIMQRGGWSSDYTLKKVYRHAMEQQGKKFSKIANNYFEEILQHEMQHKK